ncbi:reprolysin-like metallopeptidase [Flavobacterium cheniae]|uniref:Putative secreted protein (Por secretion system target) n=1 Tax=Flavobacterium cheniae TaxID=295428 RepID=A0A562KAU0_9FLAO|nr:zinc-dependent metalloprotease family protein [Flavobacterium cheniae]TDR24684.1 putative secreted protein (Por secretion system target) [Flavobacterium cheniae]TWH92404.1 putative secreted protein (Por secretion system target) [Flavobacterium cheniae]
MKKKLQFFLSIILFSNLSFGQGNFWTKTSEEKLGGLVKMERASVPSVYQIMHLDLNAFKQSLVGAPIDTEGTFSNTIVNFPNSKGELSRFRVYEAPIMEKGLADRYPDIKSYAAVGIDDPTVKLRFSVTLFGLHVMSTSGNEGTYYIDTYTKDLNNYIVYSRKDLYAVRTFACHFQDNHEEIAEQNRSAVENQILATDGIFRQYRLAMACTIEYAAFHVAAAGLTGGSVAARKAAVLAAMNVTMTRVNGVYERDMSLRMNLVANNDVIIFVDTDSFSNTNAGALINESQTVINGAIGSANYDIGHTVSTGGGGLAGLGVVCNNANKARGITGSPSPVGDPYDIDYVAHEMGHQFGGPHTFSSNDDTAGNCDSGNNSPANSVEPGSGSTIMAYAGICEENVQSNSDAYFHAVSIASMNAVMIGSGNCAPQAANGNNPPVISALTNYTIPQGTAFVLTGNATDANAGASLTYCWEQTNAAAGTNFPTSTQTTGPVYRSLNPTTSNKRYLPNFQSVLSGNLAPTWEVTPTIGRTLNFALTVRDNQTPTGGQTARANMTVTTVAAAGPFTVTSPAANASWNTNSSQTITWNVAGTTGNGINTANVNILLSTDNGVTFSTLLANTPNDGTQVVTMPATPAVNCRILVEAVGNIFYAVSPNFALGYTVTTTCNTYANNNVLAIPDGTGANVYGAVVSNTINVPTTATISDVNIGLDVTHTYPQDLQIAINHPDATQVLVWNRACAGNDNFNVTLNDGSAVFSCAANMTGTFAPSSPLSVFNGKSSNGVWTLLARDGYNGDIGQVDSWSIEICSQTVTLSSESFGLENFTLYPNPNNGNFNIQFTSTSGNEIKVNVHDIRGREIYSKSYTNNGLFNENLQLSNVQSGVYLVTVEDGSIKETKKIVVQ